MLNGDVSNAQRNLFPKNFYNFNYRKNSRDMTHPHTQHSPNIHTYTQRMGASEKCENLRDVYSERFHLVSFHFVVVIVNMNMKFIVLDRQFARFMMNL